MKFLVSLAILASIAVSVNSTWSTYGFPRLATPIISTDITKVVSPVVSTYGLNYGLSGLGVGGLGVRGLGVRGLGYGVGDLGVGGLGIRGLGLGLGNVGYNKVVNYGLGIRGIGYPSLVDGLGIGGLGLGGLGGLGYSTILK